jgi:cytochrome c553
MKYLFFSMMLLAVPTVQSASIFAGKSEAAAVCSQCHGIRATSADAPFPSLAGRDEEYIKTALKAYRDKTRISDIMNNIAGSLTDKDINNIANYYTRQKP